MTNRPENRRPLPSGPPPRFDAGRYEVLARWIEAIQDADPGAVLTHLNFMSASFLPEGKYDVNNRGPFSTDLVREKIGPMARRASITHRTGSSITTCARPSGATTSITRWDFTGGSRTRPIRAARRSVRDSFRNLWLCLDENNDPWPGDPPGWASQYYVRSARRMRSEIVLTEQDVRRTDGSAVPWPAVGCASYSMDSHNTNRVVKEFAPGQFRAWLEGSIHVLAGGVNKLTPFPYEILRPRKVDCDNLQVTFAMSATHCALSVLRMEPTSMLAGHIVGAAGCQALAGATQIAVQDIDIAALRDQLRIEGINVDAT
jgi:hypothetical protein